MGKKKDKKQKGKGAEKTALKTEKNAERKSRKRLKEQGEDDVEQMIAEFQQKAKKRIKTEEEKCEAPTPRSNMTLTPHPYKEELVMFGGEYFNGSQTFMYSDLLFYNLKSNEWSILNSPVLPPPRCAHQAVAVKQGGGQLWIFGGEFASPSQSQFYHYNDLWVFQFTPKTWEKVNAAGGPSARSGHRMTALKRQLIVFGGFHDNIRDYKYFNDLYSFNLDTYTWCQIQASGPQPLPRSACVLTCTQDQNHIIIYGGYSKERIKKDVDKGKIHTDMFRLSQEGKGKDDTSDNWKWHQVKQSGVRPSPRCSCTMVQTPGNRAIVFGGVFDEKEDEEELTGAFFNDMYSLELDKGKWHEVFLKYIGPLLGNTLVPTDSVNILRGKKGNKDRKKRRKKKEDDEEEMSEGSDLDEEVENLKVSEDLKDDNSKEKDKDIVKVATQPSSSSDNIFTVTVGGPVGDNTSSGGSRINQAVVSDKLFWPRPRMNTLLAVKDGVMYLYGGMYEEGDKQLTLGDMYSLDLHKLEEWNTIIANEADKIEYEESSSSSDSDSDDEGAVGGDESDEEDSGEDMELGEAPAVKPGESVNDYFSRNKDYWLLKADEVATQEKLDVTTKQLKKAAFKMAEEHVSLNK